MLGYYSEMITDGNRDGVHCFDSEATALLSGVAFSREKNSDEVDDILVISIEALATLDEAKQTALVEFEQTPIDPAALQPGRRLGVNNPAKTVRHQ